jgi:hypothetical protein
MQKKTYGSLKKNLWERAKTYGNHLKPMGII